MFKIVELIGSPRIRVNGMLRDLSICQFHFVLHVLSSTQSCQHIVWLYCLFYFPNQFT